MLARVLFEGGGASYRGDPISINYQYSNISSAAFHT